MKKTYEQFDMLGRELKENDVVTYASYHGGLTIARVVKLNRIRVQLQRLVSEWQGKINDEAVNPKETVKIDSRDVTVYLLKNQK